MFWRKKLQIKQYKLAFILRNGTKMPKYDIKITSSTLPNYFSNLLQCLLMESWHEWSVVFWIFQNLVFHNPAIPAKKWQKRNLFKSLSSFLKYDGYCLILQYMKFLPIKITKSYTLKILAENHSFMLHLSDMMPNQVARNWLYKWNNYLRLQSSLFVCFCLIFWTRHLFTST